MKYDFSGYVTKNDLVCSDNRVIRHDAFKECDGEEVPLVWQHGHENIENVLGHVMLENRNDGVYGYGYFNEETPQGKYAKALVQHGDLKAMSIYANKLEQRGMNPREVIHGSIKEVSLVLAGANPGAVIDNVVLAHGNWYDADDEAYIYNGVNIELYHADTDEKADEEPVEENNKDTKPVQKTNKKAKTEGTDDKSIQDILDEMSEDKKNVLYYLVGLAANGEEVIDDDDDDDDDDKVTHSDESSDKSIQDVLDSFTEDEKTVLHYLVGVAKEQADTKDNKNNEEEVKHSDSEKTIKDIIDGMSKTEQKAFYYLVGMAKNDINVENVSKDELESVKEIVDKFDKDKKQVLYYVVGLAKQQPADTINHSDIYEGDAEMKHNVFDTTDTEPENVLSHAEVEAIFSDAKRIGSLKESALQHGITDIDYLFPDAKNLTNVPVFVSRQMEWVSAVMNGVSHTPFARVRSIFANITADEARAKGYVKGKKKIDEVIALLRRETVPTTVYKHQSLDRDDIVDITDFDVVAWLKTEMRVMLDEEIARAILVGDGRANTSADKIDETKIRPIWKDDDFYTIKASLASTSTTDITDEEAQSFIKLAVKARKDYKGSGSPTLFINEDLLTTMLLLENKIGERLYKTEAELATAMRVNSIVSVPVMENQTYTGTDSKTHVLEGIIVNLKDYNVGADQGGAVSLFDDFDIDYNKQKYLIETRCSGALTMPYSAIALEKIVTTAEG